MTNLEKYLYQLRRIEEHRSVVAEKEIRKIYKELLKELNAFIANIYINYSEDDMLTYADLARVSMDARFLEEVEQRISGITPQVTKQIQETVDLTYEACYDGMRNAVVKAAGNNELLKQAFSTVKAVTPEIIRANVNNPISGLTLKDTLEKHRKDIIYDIKKNIGVGLANGDRFSTMAKRISESVDGDYKKSIRIVRTEAHRVRETGFNDAATEINTSLQNGSSGYVMAKTWKTMKDERVRPNTMYKTKAGWKKGKKSKYNHEKMDGVTIPQTELFKLPSGATCMCPSKTGVAGEDINCRCYVSYDLVLASELTGVKDKKVESKQEVRQENKKDEIQKHYNISNDFNEDEKKEILEGIEYIEDNFGKEVRNYVTVIDKENPNKLRTYEAYFDTETKGIHFNKKKECDDCRETMIHEFTHAIQEVLQNKYKTLGYSSKNSVSDELRKEIFKANGMKFTKANVKKYVSDYAAENSEEFISECVAVSIRPYKYNKEFLENALRIIREKHEMVK